MGQLGVFMIKLFLPLLLIAGSAFGGTIITHDPDRTLFVVGRIVDLKSTSTELLHLGNESNEKITIIIDSYGGGVVTGLEFIQAMDRVRSRGVTLDCVVMSAAMSMATHILAHCDNRYAFRTSLIMWHPISVSFTLVRLTEKSTEQIKTQLSLLSKYLEKTLKAVLGINEKEYNKYHENEYIVLADTLENEIAPAFLTIVDDVRAE